MKIAVVQMNVAFADVERNLSAMLEQLRAARAAGALLTIFPECALTGYCFQNLEEALPVAQSIPGPATEAFQTVLRDIGGHAVFGMIERGAGGVYNAAVLVGAAGVVGAYRKIHLPFLGVDQFATYGERPFAVHDIGGLRVGLAICYDSAFPESMRVMTLQGADLIALPTNFPTGAEGMVSHALRTRAMENNVYFACCNRVGEERGFRFIGQSQIIDPTGNWLANSDGTEAEILYAEIDPALARNKRIVRVPGKHAIDRLADRRPEMYELLTQPHALQRPGR
jgi:predicted amidohydrolase